MRAPTGNAPRAARQRGVTLLELMVALAVLAILVGLGVPSFRDLVASQRVRATASELYSALTVTRSAAVSRNRRVTITATGGSWTAGWSVADPDNVGNNLLVGAVASAVTVTPNPAGVTSLEFRPSGRLNGASIEFTVQSTANPSSIRCVSLDSSGRPTISTGACS